MRLEMFFLNGWLFCHDPETGWGAVYDPQTDAPTMPIMCNYGGPGDSFQSKAEAMLYFEDATETA